MQLATYSNVSAARVSGRIHGKMLKHGAFLLTAELGTTPTCIQSIRQSKLMLEHYTWHFFGMKTTHLISYAILLEEVLLRVNEQRNILHEMRKRKANWIGHILRRNCLLQQIMKERYKGG